MNTLKRVVCVSLLAATVSGVQAQREAPAPRGPAQGAYSHLTAPNGPAPRASAPVALKGYDTNVPGFSLGGYGRWISDLIAANPREMTPEMEGVFQGLFDWQFEYFTPMRGATKDQVVAIWTRGFVQAADVCATWGNAFVAESDAAGAVALKQTPRKDALAGLEGQPFVFLYRKAGSGAVPVVKETSCELRDGGAISVRIDPQYSTLIRLSLSGIKPGANEYPLSVLNPEGKALYQGKATLKGVEPARVKIRIVEASTKEPVETLMALHTPGGRECPPNAPPYFIKDLQPLWRVYERGPWPMDDTRVSITKGEFEMPVFPGACRLIAAKGPEYLRLDETFDAPAGALTEKTFALKRFIDLPKKNWYSGDDHTHIDRNSERDSAIQDLLLAADLHMTNILQAGDETKLIFLQDRWGELSQYWRGDHMMVTGQEDPRTPWRGHTLIFNIQNSIHDRTSYYVYEDAFKEARKNGGMTGYAHSAKDFQAELGATVSIPLNLVDFIELDSADLLHRNVIYHFWNLGFPIVAASGSDFPWAPLPGWQRFYTYVDGELTYDKYMEAFKAGHTFISKGGAFLDVRANGALPGSVVKAKSGDTLKIAVRADLNPQYDKLDRVEIVRNGEVIETLRPKDPGDSFIEQEITVKADESSWLAARLFGKAVIPVKTSPEGVHPSCAHTSPFWLEVDGKPFRNPAGLAAELARANGSLDTLIKNMDAAAPPINGELLKAQRPRLDGYIRQAREVYAKMEKATSGGTSQ